jgi:hypothetical protein
MSNVVTSESFSDDAMSIEYEDDDGAAAGDAVVGPHDDEDDDGAAAGDAAVGPHDDEDDDGAAGDAAVGPVTEALTTSPEDLRRHRLHRDRPCKSLILKLRA